MSAGILRFLVPRDWTGEQALLAARVLREALDAVWAVHGEEMAAALRDPRCDPGCDSQTDDPDIDEDDIPF